MSPQIRVAADIQKVVLAGASTGNLQQKSACGVLCIISLHVDRLRIGFQNASVQHNIAKTQGLGVVY
jgi:chemotaxis receptor (MCP) glutamine deamidase CheD